MIANMNEKGRQTKLLAAIAVLAMVICAFAAVMPSEDVSGMSEPVTSETGVTNLGTTDPLTNNGLYYVANGTGATDATVTLPSDSNGTITIYAEQGVVISITADSSNTTTVNLFVAESGSFTTTSGQKTGTVDYYADTAISFTSIANANVNVTVGQYGFTISGTAGTNYTAPTNAVTYVTGTDAPVTYFNVNAIGQNIGFSAFELRAGGSVTIPSEAVIKGNFTISNDDTSDETTEFTAANTIQFMVGATTADQADAFTVGTTAISITNENDVFTLATGSWTTGSMDVTAGKIRAAATISGDVVNSVGTGNISSQTNVDLYADLETANGKTPYYNLYAGTHSGSVLIDETDGNVNLLAGATYSGTITYNKLNANTTISDGNTPTGDVEFTQTVTLTADNSAGTGTLNLISTENGSMTVRGTLVSSGSVSEEEMYSGSNVTITALSVDYELPAGTTGTVTETDFNVNGVAFGDINVSDAVTLLGNAVTLSGTTLTFESGGSIDIEAHNFYILGDLSSTVASTTKQITGTGKIYTNSVNDVKTYYVSSDLVDKVFPIAYTIDLDSLPTGVTLDNLAERLSTLPSGSSVSIEASDNAAQNVIEIDNEITFDGLTITLTGTNVITFSINNGASFVLNNTTINDQTAPADQVDSHDDSKIVADEGSAITINNSRLYLVVDVDEGASETINNTGVVYENTSSDVQVGYGTTLTLRDSTNVNTIDIYGTLVISGNVTIPTGETMMAHDKSSIVIDGSLTVLGTAQFEAGSSTEVNGTFNVGQSNQGGAIVNIESDFVVSETGTMTVNPGVTGNVYSHNTLNAPAYDYADADGDEVYSYAYKFEVYGALAMNGQMSGYVHDLGTVTLNGSAVTGMTPTIVVYQDITLNVSSFNGTLNVSDAGICDETMDGRENMRASTGNKIQLQNVTGATVSVSVDTYNYTKSDDSNHRDFRSVMSVYGTLGAVTGTSGSSLTIVSTGAVTYKDGVGANSNQTAYITVPEGETLSFGTNVGWTINDLVVVDGDVNFVKAVNMTDSKNISGSKDTGVLTVNSTVTITGQVTLPETVVAVNAMKYSVLDTSTGITTYTYTNFSDAIDAAPTAQQSTAYVFGDVTVAADKDVAAGITVSFNTGSQLTIDEGVVLTIADGATFSGATDAAIVVDGTMASNDYTNDMRITDIESDVVRTEGTVRTWTSLYNAINELGWTDITLSGAVIIDEDLTIPAGTTVTTNVAPVTDENGTYSILVKGATLTVEGTLEMQSTARGALDVAQNSAGEDGEIVVTGTVVRTVMTSAVGQDFEYFKSGDNAVDGVFFTLRQGANSTFYITNMANAGTIVSATTYLDGNVEVCGSVSAQDASFAVAENAMAYSIVVTDGSNLSMGTLTINGATFTVEDAQNTMFTGSVSAPVGDGAASTVVEMNRAASISLQSYNEIGVSTTYGLAAYGSFTGAVTVSQGTLDIGRGTNNGLTVSNDASMDVASGAVLNIASGRTLTINDADGVVINGTLNVANASGISGTGVTLTVAGTMNVDVNSFGTSVVLDVTGTLNVLEDYVMNVGTAMIVGAPAESLGVGGAISGNYNITGTGYILAYAGADLSQARINWNTSLNESDALTTTYYVNDIEYATVYADGGVYIVGLFGVNDEGSSQYYEIDLVGYDTGIYNHGTSVTGVAYTWYNADDEKIANDAQIGSTESVYIEFDVAQVLGTISKDAGIILTIDDLVIGSNGDVSQTVRNYGLTVGTHTISWSERTGYSIADVTVTFNGVEVENGGTITITADMTDYTIIADGAVPSAAPGGDTSSDDGMGLTDYLLIVLVVLIVIMAIMVALRLMRS